MPKRESQSYLRARLDRIASLEREGRLSPSVAARIRRAIEEESSGSRPT
jgi:hypothetical protein